MQESSGDTRRDGLQEGAGRFQLPQRLYGRDTHVATLLQGVERVARGGKPELILVRGYSGIGKSSVVYELRKPVDVAVDAMRNTYVADEQAGVLLFSPQGQLLATLASEELQRPKALTLDPNDEDARLGLGWVELLSGHSVRAAEVWRPVAGVTKDGPALAAMAKVFEKVGDRQSLKRVQTARVVHIGERVTD